MRDIIITHNKCTLFFHVRVTLFSSLSWSVECQKFISDSSGEDAPKLKENTEEIEALVEEAWKKVLAVILTIVIGSRARFTHPPPQ